MRFTAPLLVLCVVAITALLSGSLTTTASSQDQRADKSIDTLATETSPPSPTDIPTEFVSDPPPIAAPLQYAGTRPSISAAPSVTNPRVSDTSQASTAAVRSVLYQAVDVRSQLETTNWTEVRVDSLVTNLADFIEDAHECGELRIHSKTDAAGVVYRRSEFETTLDDWTLRVEHAQTSLDLALRSSTLSLTLVPSDGPALPTSLKLILFLRSRLEPSAQWRAEHLNTPWQPRIVGTQQLLTSHPRGNDPTEYSTYSVDENGHLIAQRFRRGHGADEPYAPPIRIGNTHGPDAGGTFSLRDDTLLMLQAALEVLYAE